MGQQSEGLPLQNKKNGQPPGQKNVAHPVLGSKSKFYLLPVNINFGLRKISVKAMDK